MHHFVVRQRQHEVFGKGVEQTEGQLVVVVTTMDRVVRHVIEHVVHPAHVPFVVEAQPPHFRRTADRRPGGGFLGVGRGARAFLPEHLVHPAQEVYRFEVFTPPVDVGNPLTGLAAVVAVEHRGHGIDAQTIDTVVLDPEQRIADQIVEHLAATEVVDQRAPVLVHAFTRVGVLVERLTVETAQPVRIGREVRWHPVNDHFQSGLMAGVDEIAAALRRTETGRRCIQAQRLIAPGTVKGVFGDRQQFDVREAQIGNVGDQRFLEPLPVREAFVFTPPGTQMHLVDRHRRTQLVTGHAGPARRNLRELADHRGGCRTQLGSKAVGVGLLRQEITLARTDFVLVAGSHPDARNENLPDTALATQAHRMTATIPGVEITDDADPLRIGRPHGKGHALDTVDLAQMRAEPLVRPQVRAFGEQPDVEFAEHRREAVGILDLLNASRPGDAQPVVEQLVASEDRGLEKAGMITQTGDLAFGKFDENLARIRINHMNRRCTGLYAAQPQTLFGVGMQSQYGKRVAVFATAQRQNFSFIQHISLSSVRIPCSRCRSHIHGWCGRTRSCPCRQR